MSLQRTAWTDDWGSHLLDPRRRLILLVLPLATGASLVGFIVLGLPLPVGLAMLAALSVITWGLAITRATPDQRSWLARRVKSGAAAGVPALIAYDLARFGLVSLASLSFAPFHVLPLFGYALLGPTVSEPAALIAGLAFHVANGLGFAVAFAIAVRRPSIVRGIGWALVLEAAMLALYPAWLGIAMTGELLPVSVAGHVAYGSVLGAVAARRLR
jgi:hypothetical protein